VAAASGDNAVRLTPSAIIFLITASSNGRLWPHRNKNLGAGLRQIDATARRQRKEPARKRFFLKTEAKTFATCAAHE
jgi:hypothetical protein